jgi:cysteine desulfurase
MAAPRAYLDHNATAPLRPRAREALVAALAEVGNPSSIHAEGRAARKLVEAARATIAQGFGVMPTAVTFTSGGSEAAATLLAPGFGRDRKTTGRARSLLVSAIEHPCVLAGGRFPREAIRAVGVTRDGALDLSALDTALADADGPVIIALMGANNETGVVQPI